jgi:pyridoxal phosphate enzyme (YggS family)
LNGTIERNLQDVQERIAEAALRAGRDPGEVTLVAVTKTFPPKVVLEGYQAGLRDFGENRAEEGALKIPAVNAALDGPLPTWHMVGHVQSRKAVATVQHFDLVHSVDRPKLARRLSRFAQEADRVLPVLLECNISGEEAKHGFRLAGWKQDASQLEPFLAACSEILALPGIRVEGLMTMAPWTSDAQQVRPVFCSLRELRAELRSRFPQVSWRELSMGMSDDFEVAIEEGATMVRIGRALFGSRETN